MTDSNSPDQQAEFLLISGSQQSQDLSEIHSQELESTLKSMKKIHKISKQRKLTQFKKKNIKCNQIFKIMNKFFNYKYKKKHENKQKFKRKTQVLKEAKKMSLVNRNHRKQYTSALGQQLSNLRRYLKNQEPIITQDHIKVEVKCFMCNNKYSEIHFFYGDFCPQCAAFNYEKRLEKTDLSGKTALVTGARIKIGFEIVLKLLEDGATVYGTSRFSSDTLLRFMKHPNYPNWKHRLHIIQCDFVSSAQVTKLITFIKENISKLDILINNAAQTIVRPKIFYKKQLENEQLQIECSDNNSIVKYHSQIVSFENTFPSLVPLQNEEKGIDFQHEDQFGQPIDRRQINSWKEKIEDVTLTDCYTTQLVNSIVPFHLISQLKSLMIGSPQNPSFVINVSSMEGIFYRKYKQQFHPHTNMAKAALNMTTRTCSGQFSNHHIYMNSVDTGWVTNQNPLHIVEGTFSQNGFKCPLDCRDGAMRVLNPVYEGLINKKYIYGKFLKDYKESFW